MESLWSFFVIKLKLCKMLIFTILDGEGKVVTNEKEMEMI